MRWQAAKSAIISHFASEWGGLHPGMAVNFPNEGDENEPDEGVDAEDLDPESGEWLRFRFLSSYSHRIAVGGQTREQGGRIVIHVFSPAGDGDARSESLCTDLETIYETAHDSGLPGDIHLGAPEPIYAELDVGTQQYMSGRVIPFLIDHTP